VKDGFESIELRSVVVPVKLLNAAMLVSEHAAGSIHALLGVVEGPAVLALELFVVTSASGGSKFLLTVSKSAFVLVAALGSLDPILAKFGLVFSVGVHLHHLVAHWVSLFVIGLLRVASWASVEACLAIVRLGLRGHCADGLE